jgi:hypothetical protein
LCFWDVTVGKRLDQRISNVKAQNPNDKLQGVSWFDWLNQKIQKEKSRGNGKTSSERFVVLQCCGHAVLQSEKEV